MTPAEINAALDEIEKADPVAELAARLIYDGVTEVELQKALGGRTAHPLGNELQNKYRDVARCGWTENRYHKRWSRY
jgi:hypothetical protein